MIEQLAKQIFNDIQQTLANGNTEKNASASASKIKALIEANLRKLNLVTRDEFDAQQSVLVRTREKLEQLEKQMQSMEQAIQEASKSDNS
ncbi:accessory factor UbiK family protein [Agarilytica rhodophyticola]|uniref:accessory factor UbiK family protein n=1 Tax=Agarilytica rhodophyticola TaxID=1737490 RepID=UPI000B3432ED|nr:accessory factor UbiK family protein [Agarilytica rhodophyticola]